MVSFTPEDVIFLLNKWDTISHLDVEQQNTFFEETTESLHKLWKEVDDSCIFRNSAIKVKCILYNVVCQSNELKLYLFEFKTLNYIKKRYVNLWANAQ